MSEKKPVPALIQVLENTPDSWYGNNKARLSRRSVHVALAKYANTEGKNCWASLASISYIARVSIRTAQEVIDFLVARGSLAEREELSAYGTKVYDLVLPTGEEAEQAKRERLQLLEKERQVTRQRVAKYRVKRSCNGNLGITEQPDVMANGAACNGKQRVTVTEDSAECNAQTAVDLSSDLSRESRREKEADAPTAALSPADSAEADTVQLRTQEEVERLWKATKRAFFAVQPDATIYPKHASQITKQIVDSEWTERALTDAAIEIAKTLDGFECHNAGGILAEKLDATIERMNAEYRAELLRFFDALLRCWEKMTDDDRKALEEWETETHRRKLVTGLDAIGTAEWPGWQRYGITPPARWQAAVDKAAHEIA